jgi:hypothetical protein
MYCHGFIKIIFKNVGNIFLFLIFNKILQLMFFQLIKIKKYFLKALIYLYIDSKNNRFLKK